MQVCVLVAVFGCMVSGILSQNQPNFGINLPASRPGSPPFQSPIAPPRPPPPSSPPSAGFSVRKAVVNSRYTVSAVQSPVKLRFQNVLSNYGAGWARNSHEFVAPSHGGYFFTFNAISTRTRDFTLALMKNGIYQVTAYAPAGYQWAGNSAFLLLRRGDRVSLTLQDGEIYEHPLNEAYTTFSGFLAFVN